MKIPNNLKKQKISGIYCIENIINKKRYIGSSMNIYQRIQNHRNKLRKNNHCNSILQNSYNKYGEENFVIYLLEESSENHLTKLEQNWINKLNPEYNITLLVERNVLSKSSKIKISNTLKDKYSRKEIISITKPIDVYNTEGLFVKSYDSCKECSKDLKISQHTISNVLNGKYFQGCNYIFAKKGEQPNLIKKSKKGIKVILSSGRLNKEFNSFSEAARFINSPICSLHRAYKANKNYKKYIIKVLPVPVKLDELLENPEEDNQQPSLGNE